MENKRIGIITFHAVDNYGAVLQAYALQHYIETNISPDVVIIDYRNKKKSHSIFGGRTRNPLKNVILNFLDMFHRQEKRMRHQKFEEFRQNFFRLSKRYEGVESLKDMESFDYYISGSDQVFNPAQESFMAYYLGFSKGKGKKVAYAPSFGISVFTEEITTKILPLLKDFDVLSCREQTGATYISRIINNQTPVVLDPVFLLPKAEWENQAVKPHNKDKYLFVYCLTLGKSAVLQSMAEEVAKKENLKIVTIGNTSSVLFRRHENIVGPLEFVGLIMSAEIVVTDSFHGTSFSLIFGKRVLSYIANKKVAARIETIMKIFGRESDVIYDIDNYEYSQEQSFSSPDIHEKKIEESKLFLKESLI